jgi:alkylation response protein AidB-like acyl-CoA dehydrogenase
MDEVGGERVGVSAYRRVGVWEACAGSTRRYARTQIRFISPFKPFQDVQRLDQVSAH